MTSEPAPIQFDAESSDLEKKLRSPKYEKYARFVVAAMSSIPWVGGVIGALSALHAEAEQARANDMIYRWLEDHRQKIHLLGVVLNDIVNKVEQIGPEAQARLDDEQYLSLARQGFRIWDEANTESKRESVRRTLTNAASSSIASDDLIRLFLDWIERYDEIHFKVIRVLFQNRGATRGRIWDEIGNVEVREDSPEADLFKLLIHDLSMGHVLRQIRQTNHQGQFLAKPRKVRTGRATTLESAFEDTKPYELTAMGEQFATYVLNETLPRLS